MAITAKSSLLWDFIRDRSAIIYCILNNEKLHEVATNSESSYLCDLVKNIINKRILFV